MTEPTSPAILTKKRIGIYLGVSESTVIRYIKEHGLPVHKQGGLTLAYPEELEAWRRGELPQQQKAGNNNDDS